MRESLSIPKSPTIPAEEWGPGYRLWVAIQGLLDQRGPDGTTSVVRIGSHLVILAVAALVLIVSRLELPSWDIAEAEGARTATAEFAPGADWADETVSTAASLVRAAVPRTLIPERPRTDIVTHVVQPGDTLYAIADQYKISAETLVWANNMDQNPDLLRLGQELVVLPTSGILHTVAQGETLESIAKKWSADAGAIAGFEWNQLDANNPALTAGQKVIVPGGTKPRPVQQQVSAPAASRANAPADAAVGAGRFVWPAAGSISQGYYALHRAIDIAGRTGNGVKASDAGYIAVAGWSNVGYGNHVIIDHGNGFQTLYAHLSAINVSAGQSVNQGDVIGAVGSTGRSTGPHLHFEVRENGAQRNPFGYLP